MVSIKPLSVTYYKEMINGPWCMEVLLEYNKSALGAIHYFVSFERVLTNIIPGRSYRGGTFFNVVLLRVLWRVHIKLIKTDTHRLRYSLGRSQSKANSSYRNNPRCPLTLHSTGMV